MLRYVLAAVSVVCLLLCAAAAAMWARSFWRMDSVVIWTGSTPVTFSQPGFWPPNVALAESYRGQFRVIFYADATAQILYWRQPATRVLSHPAGARAATNAWDGFAQRNMTTRAGRWGFEYASGRSVGFLYAPLNGVTVPYWSLVLLTAIPPTFWITRRARAARRCELGHCPTCGYDLRASTDRCPECGTAAHRVAAPTTPTTTTTAAGRSR